MQWQSGVITELHPGEVNLTRVVTLKVGEKTIKRPITKICPLPVENDTAGSANVAGLSVNNASNSHDQSNMGKSVSSNLATVTTKLRSKVNRSIVSMYVLPIITALLSMHCTGCNSFPMNTSEPFEIMTFQKPPGLYFEPISSVNVVNSKWNLITVVDLVKFEQTFTHLKNQTESIKSACKARFDEDDSCWEWVRLIEQRMEKIRDELSAIGENHIRSKRAVFDFIGDLAGDIFGVLGSRFRREYESNIMGLLSNDEHLLQLLRNQTTVVEATMNILKKTEGEWLLQDGQFKNFTVRIKKTMDEYAAASFFSDAVALIIQNMNDFDNQLDIMARVIYDCHNLKVNHDLLPPKQLAKELNFVSEQVKHKYRVPDANDVYNIISISSHVTKTQILFRLSIPLMNLNEYELFRIVPIPFPRNGTF